MSNKPLFEKVLVANRGEIAIRIMKTLKKMGIKSVAVYSESDTNALHVQEADEAYYIGSSSATDSYLSIKNIIAAVQKSGAQAVHPGYGFLSENYNFAKALEDEGIKLIGPSSDAIRMMGDKIEAKKIAVEASVSTVPGYMGIIKSTKQAIEIAQEIGYPVIVKAAAGGGGRGMRVVANDTEMADAFESARIEAKNSFNDNRVFIEKFITKPRHIEIQLLADEHGNAVCLGERECSIQRQHQKVIEEAPSPFITEDIRQEMYAQVLSLAARSGYYSAGTVEFIMSSDKNFYFLEMNTRLQVEHCVTELVTGIDIVEQMIRIAAGESLSFTQQDIKIEGSAIECRIYAEDPLRGFLPSSGRISEYEEPPRNSSIRIDSGIGPGGEVSMFYDPMIAKLCTHSSTREQAVEIMQSALGAFVIRGITHNMSFLEAIMTNPRFISGDMNTSFIEEEYPDGFLGAELTSEVTKIFLGSVLHIFMMEQKRAASIKDQVDDQVNKLGTRWVVFIDDNAYPIFIQPVPDGFNIRNGKNRISVRSKSWTIGSKLFSGEINGKKVNVKVDPVSTGYILTHAGVKVKAHVRSPRIAELASIMPEKREEEFPTELIAPLSGAIISVKVKEGDKVTLGQPLVVLTAMKMENIITASAPCIVSKINIKPGDHVSAGQVLIEYEC